MEPQAYKVVKTHAHEISRWTILSRLLHARPPHLEGMNCDIQYDLSTLEFNNLEQLEDFHSRILRLQQKIILSGENVSPTRHLFQCMKAFLKSDKTKALIAPNTTDPITFPDNNGKIGCIHMGKYSWTLSLYINGWISN